MENLTIKEIEVMKLNLKEDDVLAIVVKSDSINGEDMMSLGQYLKQVFPNNKTLLHLVGLNDQIEYKVISNGE